MTYILDQSSSNPRINLPEISSSFEEVGTPILTTVSAVSSFGFMTYVLDNGSNYSESPQIIMLNESPLIRTYSEKFK